MKKIRFLLALLGMVLTANAQDITQNDGSLVYYMPKQVLVFDIEYQEATQERGIFYQYSERYLGTKDIVTENQTTYTLTNIALHTQTQADKARAYRVYFNEKYPICSLLNLTEKGLLAGVNLPAASCPKPTKKLSKQQAAETHNTTVMPLLEEQLVANSTAKMAEGTARQIYRIRETRLNLLAGDADHVPADGKAMQLVLAELDKQEQALTELFVGRTTVKTLHKKVIYTPETSTENAILFRFSAYQGLVDENDLSGEPYYLTLQLYRQNANTDNDSPKKQAALSPIYYNIPGSANITLFNAEQTWIETTVDIPQAGIAKALPLALFNSNLQVRFNTKTGAIQSITQ
ncbi:MAG: DUF4831 family protein [Paludibacter sp.]|nr:DUF4831 family protein [Bacteroidales bacterium]MCM1069486.1 DUF4831 family protein [Prevotella sp.]MCM1354142.1 DUF4831 family protein [Bacteroides sp.]MCM1443001.1 DUF4831 family protein [Muribaculum sp.]MCM1482217.1 DUF4831 family protein [Paludibacter sp.]